MNDLPRLQNLRSTSQLLREATSSFTSNSLTFLLLSLLLFSFRTLIETGATHLTTLFDGDPSLRAILFRLDLAGNTNHRRHDPSSAALRRHHHRRRPFLHLTRVGTLDDDFFSGDDDDGRSLFGSSPKSPVNGSFVVFGPKSGFSDLVVDNGIRVSEVVRSGITFRAEGLSFADDGDGDGDGVEEEEDGDGKGGDLGNGQGMEKGADLKFFVKGFELGRRDSVPLFLILGFLSVAYLWVIFVFVVTCSLVYGVVFIAVVNDLLGRFSSVTGLIFYGSRLGLRRLPGFFLMRWAVRDALTQLLGLWYFGEIEDQYSFFKLFFRLKLMPLSVISPWVPGYENEISGFLFTWFLVDTFVGFVFSVDAWVAIVDPRRRGREVVKEGCYLLSKMLNQAIQIKCLEAIFCGSFVRWCLGRICGRSLAMMFQLTMEVYFMVAWLIFYFVARCKDANLQGTRFGKRELEGLVEGRR